MAPVARAAAAAAALTAACAPLRAGAAAAAPPADRAVVLRNNVSMPRIAVGIISSDAAAGNIERAWQAGVTHFHTARDYYTQPAVGAGLRALGVPRDAYFLTTMTSPCRCNQSGSGGGKAPSCLRDISDPAACYNVTRRELELDLQDLGVAHVDLVLLHAPNEPFGNAGGCGAAACAANRVQWRAYSEFLREGRARAIGVSNFCRSCFECMLEGGTDAVVPAVNQVSYHVAMGPDPEGLISYCAQRSIVVQAYEPLAAGAAATDPTCARIGAAHNKTAAQAAMRWVLQNPVARPATAVLTHASSPAYLAEDMDVFDWRLTAAEMAAADAMTCAEHPSYFRYSYCQPSWACGK